MQDVPSEDHRHHRKLAAIMFTDMVGYSAMTQRNEARALALLEEHAVMLRSIFPRHNGREISIIGDAFLVEFQSALEAVECAVEIQDSLVRRNADVAADDTIRLRIGIHCGDVVHSGDDVLGDGVNIAARIEPCAVPEGICISEDVARQVQNKIPYDLRRLPKASLKNIELSMELYALVLPWLSDAGERRTRPGGGSPLRAMAANLSPASLKRRSARGWLGIAGGVVFIGAVAWLALAVLSPRPDTGRFRLGIVQFQNVMRDSLIADWPVLIQTLFVGEITGTDRIAVIHDLSINGLLERSLGGTDPQRDDKFYEAINTAKPNLIIDGSIVKGVDGVNLQMNITDPVTREIKHSSTVKCASVDSLRGAVRTLAKEVLEYLEIKVFRTHEDITLNPWITTKNMGALTAFIQASNYMYHFDPEAEKYLRRAIELDSTFLSARVWLISLLMKRNDTLEARTHLAVLHRFEESANPFEQTMIEWSDAFIRRDAVAQIRFLTMALEYSPRNNILLFLLGRQNYMLNRPQECIDALVPAIEMKWPYSPAYYLLGVCHHQRNNDPEAVRVLEQSLSIKPTYEGVYLLLGTLCAKSGDTTKSKRYADMYLRSAVERGATWSAAFTELADALARENMPAQAMKLYRRAVDENPRAPEYHRKLGVCLLAAGDTLGGAREIARTLELDPRNALAHFALGALSENAGDMKNARRHYQSFLKLDSTSAESHTLRLRLASSR